MNHGLVLEGARRVFDTGDDEIVAVDDVDLTVEPEELVALVGPSGSGKTPMCSSTVATC